jgi:hypothetical protein
VVRVGDDGRKREKIGEAAMAYRCRQRVSEEEQWTLGHALNRLDARGLIRTSPTGWDDRWCMWAALPPLRWPMRGCDTVDRASDNWVGSGSCLGD